MSNALKLNNSAICQLSQQSPLQVLELALSPGVSHVCQNENPFQTTDMLTAELMQKDPKTFMKSPVTSILNPLGANTADENSSVTWKRDFSKAKEKKSALQDLKNEMAKRKVNNSTATDILLIADELFTNAVFNAPFATETMRSPKVSRADNTISMRPGDHGTLFMACNDERIILGCRDPYGQLRIESLLTRIRDCYKEGVANKMNFGDGGAGIGSFMIFDSVSNYYAAVDKAKATLLTVCIPLKMSSRKRSEVFKNIHWIKLEE